MIRRLVDSAAFPPCPVCARPIADRFCPDCGEARPDPRERTLGRFLLGWVDAATSMDGRFLGSFRALLLRPGALTQDYLAGVRKRRLTPMQIVLFANLIFFVAQAVSGAAVLNTPFYVQVQNQVYSGWAKRLAREELARRGTTEDEFVPRFDRRADDASRTLVLLLVPLFAGLLALVRLPQRRGAVEQLAFAAELVAFATTYVLSTMCLILAALQALAARGLSPSVVRVVYESMPYFAALGAGAWLILAFRRLYGDRPAAASFRAAIICFGAIVPLTLYRLLLFLFALKTA